MFCYLSWVGGRGGVGKNMYSVGTTRWNLWPLIHKSGSKQTNAVLGCPSLFYGVSILWGNVHFCQPRLWKLYHPQARSMSYSGVENGSNKTGYRPSYEEIITTKSWPRLFPIRDAKSMTKIFKLTAIVTALSIFITLSAALSILYRNESFPQ